MSCVLFLIDESTALAARVAEGTKSKADSFATALNALLSQLAAGPPIDVAVVGYRLGEGAAQDVGCRWGGALEGKRLVSIAQLEANPQTVENRIRKIPGPGGYGVAREEAVRFPIWYVPLLKASGSRRVALEFCRDLLALEDPADRSKSSELRPPLVIHLLAELSGEEGFRAVGDVFGPGEWLGPVPLVLHAHLATSSRVPSTLYPSSDANLSPQLLRHVFEASSVLPEPLAAGLRAAGVAFHRGARGLIFNARMVDLIRFFGVVKAYAAWAGQPAAAATSTTQSLCADVPTSHAERQSLCAGLPTPHIERPEVFRGAGALRSEDRPGQEICAERSQETSAELATRAERPLSMDAPGADSPALPRSVSLVVFVLDRSSATPNASAMDAKSAWRRLEDRANDMIGQLARQPKVPLEIALVAYGVDPNGGVQVSDGFVGSAAERTWLGASELIGSAIRVDEFTEKVSNGIGGLLTINRKRPVLFDLPPTPPASPVPAFARVREMLTRWGETHPGVHTQPVVVHCTRGQFEADVARDAVAKLRDAEASLGPVTLYHVIVAETSHRAMAYPATPDGIEQESLRALWELTSPLLGAEALARKRPGVSAASRGMVINAAFDVLADSVGGER